MIQFNPATIDQYIGKIFKHEYSGVTYNIKRIKDVYFICLGTGDVIILQIGFEQEYAIKLKEDGEKAIKYNHKNKEQFALEPNKIFL